MYFNKRKLHPYKKTKINANQEEKVNGSISSIISFSKYSEQVIIPSIKIFLKKVKKMKDAKIILKNYKISSSQQGHFIKITCLYLV